MKETIGVNTTANRSGMGGAEMTEKRRRRNAKTSSELELLNIISAQPGWSKLDPYERDDEEVRFHHEPIIAWIVMRYGNHIFCRPMPVVAAFRTDADCEEPDLLLCPEGRVFQLDEMFCWDSEVEALAHFKTEFGQRARWTERQAEAQT